MSELNDTLVTGRVTQTEWAIDDRHLVPLAQARALLAETFKGLWAADVTYLPGESVRDTGVLNSGTGQTTGAGFYIANVTNLNARPATHSTVEWKLAAKDGANSFSYVGYATDASGGGFSLSPSGKTYVAFLVSPTALAAPVAGDFAGLWVRFVADATAGSTTDLTEGTNLYYTDARVRACVLTGFVAGTGAITASDTVLTLANKTQGRLAVLEAWTTANVTENTNLYYTDARARAAITGTSPVVVSSGVVSVNAASANTASYLVQRDASGDFAARKIVLGTSAAADHLTLGAACTLGYTSSTLTANVPFKATRYLLSTTHDLRTAAGEMALYSITETANIFSTLTGKLVVTALRLTGLTGLLKANGSGDVTGAATTADLTEGSNLYFTNTRADTRADLRIAAVAGVANGLAQLGADSKLATAQIPAVLVGGANYQGTWNANSNSPALATGIGTKGFYYVVSTAGTTNLDGVTTWQLGDWAIFNGAAWQKVDNTDAVLSVNGFVGAVSLVTDDVAEDGAPTNLWFTTARVLATALTGFSSTTGAITAADTLLSAFNKTQGRLAVLEAWTTSNVTEGSNLYYTDARVKTLAASGLNSVLVAPAASTSGSPSLFTVTGPAHTALAASTEAPDVFLNLNRIVQFATGTLALQRAVRIGNPKYGFVGASTLAEASTLEIAGAPLAHTNATITTAYALKVAAGALNSDVASATSLFVAAPTGAGANYCAVFATGNVGIGTLAPVTSALLELASTSKGFLPPRLTKVQRDAISSPAIGLTLYQTDNTPGLRVWNGTNWMRYSETTD